MNVRTALTLSAVFMLSLTGCATQTQSQLDRQSNQLEVISASLKQIQANQQQSIALQHQQAALQNRRFSVKQGVADGQS
ncbi:Uncharacterized protein AC503_5624 [Pseudomonas syringae pv. maculicola]|nr:hypothetical protein [Pseudomonas syringae group genomosp. 3]KPC00463.1 Uncharacterized protein AC503_5624 [Pseudomonas syringae pv. maculicola]